MAVADVVLAVERVVEVKIVQTDEMGIFVRIKGSAKILFLLMGLILAWILGKEPEKGY